MTRPQKNVRKGKGGEKRLAWDDWQRYVQKETQRLIKKGGRPVVEVSLSEPETKEPPRQVEEPAHHQVEHYGPDPSEGRRPPVPGVPREEALQVSDDVIGRTVKPFKVQDYRNIKPMSSLDPVRPSSEATAREIEAGVIDKRADHDAKYEEVSDTIEPVTSSTRKKADSTVSKETRSGVAVVEPRAKPSADEGRSKSRGRKKKHADDQPALFSENISEHQAVNRRRLAKKGRLEREELIEKLLDPVISLEEAATLIGVCKTTVRRYTNRDELECLRTPGQQRRFKLSQVLEFVKKREEEEKERRKGAAKKK